MKYYVCAEGGGSKLLAILYDENFRIVRKARAGAVNDRFKDKEAIRAEMEALTKELIPDTIDAIAGVDLSIVSGNPALKNAILARFPNTDVQEHGEGTIALAASGYEEGIVAQAGTGSDAYMIQKDREEFIVGGWGSILGDQGSGYDIGHKGLMAAIRSHDGWGEPTMLVELLEREFGYTDGILKNCYHLVRHTMDRTHVAAFSRVVGAAAKAGDKVAIEILADAGRDMAEQVLCAIRRVDGDFRGPIIASGGAWRASPVMFDTFRERVLAIHPDTTVMRPIFEPVIGGIVCRFGASEELLCKLKENFGEYRYCV